jgi:ABC-type phosphate/phosphonate transport system permease subunit
MVSRVKGKNKLVSNEYYVRKKNFDIAIRQTNMAFAGMAISAVVLFAIALFGTRDK